MKTLPYEVDAFCLMRVEFLNGHGLERSLDLERQDVSPYETASFGADLVVDDL